MDKKNKNPLNSFSVFICNSCRLACVATPSSWIFAYRKKTSDLQLDNAKPYVENKTIVLNFTEKWTFLDNYTEIAQQIKKDYYINLPLCDCCMKKMLSMGFCQFSLSQVLELYLSKLSIPKDARLFTEDVYFYVQKAHAENRDFRKASKMAIDQKVTPYQTKRATIISKGDNNITSTSNSYKMPRFKQTSLLKACSLHTSFLISYHRHYATINGFRLGSLTPDTVSRKEVDTGLFFLAQLVLFIGNSVGEKISNIRTRCFLEVKCDHDFSEVHFPSPKSKQKKYDLFNSCMDAFFQICFNIFSKPCINESQRRPPFQIDISAKKIGDLPYKFSKKEPSRWTHVMRLLAINLKTIQFLALENFVNSTE